MTNTDKLRKACEDLVDAAIRVEQHMRPYKKENILASGLVVVRNGLDDYLVNTDIPKVIGRVSILKGSTEEPHDN